MIGFVSRAPRTSVFFALLFVGVFAQGDRYPAYEETPEPVAPLSGDLTATIALSRARERQHSGSFVADVTCVRESFLGGRDTLRGTLEFGPGPWERRLVLRGKNDGFEWWSRENGTEQWRREGRGGRLRRLAPYSRKKPAFAPDISYEDLARLPFGYLEGHRGARRVGETDSTVTLALAPGGALAVLYASLEVTLGRRDALLRRVLFTGNGSRPSKTMTVGGYVTTPEGAFPAEIAFTSADGLSSTRLYLVLSPPGVARDKADASERSATPGFAEPRWVPRDAAVP